MGLKFTERFLEAIGSEWTPDEDTQQAIIGSILFEAGYQNLVKAVNTVPPEWFTSARMRCIYEAAIRLLDAGLTVDSINIKDQLSKKDLILVGGYPGLIELLGGDGVEDIGPLGIALRRQWLTRESLKMVYYAVAKIQEDGNADRVLPILAESANDLMKEVSLDAITLHASLIEKAERGEALLPPDLAANAPTFGVQFLDEEINATPKRLGVIAAKTSAGKSSVAYQICVESAKKDKHVLLVSLESDAEEVAAAMSANLSHLNRGAIMRYGTPGFMSPYSDKVKANVHGLYPQSGASWEAIERNIRALHRVRPLDVIILDYFTLLDPPNYKGRSLASLFGEISKAAKRLAQQLKCSVILLSQFNRGIEDGQEPFLENLRETGQLEQDADWVVLLWANPNDEPDGTRLVHAKGAKNRGAKRNFKGRMRFYPAESRFVEEVSETTTALTMGKPPRASKRSFT